MDASFKQSKDNSKSFGGTIQKKDNNSQQSELVNKRSDNTNLIQLQQKADDFVDQEANKHVEGNSTGLPDNLKSGIENLSGYSMDDVNVHYNSNKPDQLQAHAFAQGTDIHLASGQEKHLPHEAWHVIQQRQGRVQPTTEVQGMPINDNNSLEQEADIMGAKAAQLGGQEAIPLANLSLNQGGNVQRKVIQRQADSSVLEEKKAKVKAIFEARIRPQLFILEGQNSWFNRTRNTTFNQLLNATANYNAAEADKKEKALEQVRNLGEKWLDRHKEIKSADEQIKHKSITALLNFINEYRQDDAAAAKDEFMKPQAVDTTPDDAGEKIESTSTFMEKAREVVTGNDTIYTDIIKHYTTYQNDYVKVSSESSSTGLKMLAEVALKSQEVLDKIKEWHGKHSVDGFLASAVEHVFLDYERKRAILSQIQQHLNVFSFSVDLSDQVTVRGANISTTVLSKELTGLGIQIALPNGQVYEEKNFGMTVEDGDTKFNYNFKHAIELNNEVKLDDSNVILEKELGKIVNIRGEGNVAFIGQPAHTENGSFTDPFTEVALTKDNTWSLPTKEFSYEATVDGDLHFSSSTVSITEGSAAAAEADLDLTIKDKVPNAKGKVSKVKMSKAGFGWKKSALNISGGFLVNKLVELAEIEVHQEGMHTGYKRTVTSGNVNLSLNKGPVAASISDGEVSLSKSVTNSDWSLSTFALDFGFDYENLFSSSVERAIYSDSDKKLSLKSLTVTLKSDVLPGLENTSAELEGLVIQDKGSAVETDFEKITIRKPASTFKPNDGISYKTPAAISLTKLAKGKYKLDIGDSALDIKAGNWLDADATASAEFTFDAGQKVANSSLITVKTATITLGSALNAHLKGLKGTVDNLTIASSFKGSGDDPTNDIDWGKITVTNPQDGAVSFGGPISVMPPKKAEILSPKQKYKTTLTGATGTANIPGMQATGAVNFSFDSTGKVSLEDGSKLSVDGKTGKIPPKIPGWPVSLTVPFPMGGLPFEASVRFEAGGGVALNYNLSFAYEKKEVPSLALKGTMGADGEIFANVTISAGVGSTIALYAGVYAETGAKAVVKGNATLNGRFLQNEKSFTAEELTAVAEMKGNLTASLKFGAEARALYFFRKKLYEFEAANWNIGEASKTLTYSLMGEDDGKKYSLNEGSGVLSPNGENLKLPDANATKENKEGQALDEISRNLTGYTPIDSAKAEIAAIIDGENGSLRKTSPDAIEIMASSIIEVGKSISTDVAKNDSWKITRAFNISDSKERHEKVEQVKKLTKDLEQEANKLASYIENGNLPAIIKFDKLLSDLAKYL
ncbi:eCIS core domain-containing protein [Psychroflexus planctonicus]|uniref:eCIS core domain-containing protein n=1 Tax=Psychroflexus planctonicus TaxID=1526575 RepID=A0ABQ1SKN9_9FLAO|nr:DUF4157 domain-containing protein [Psychroflexus planctonicus]GGE41155.1 hypothetical protein GCM10010832_21480 [Psychroflexus planctonicus]